MLSWKWIEFQFHKLLIQHTDVNYIINETTNSQSQDQVTTGLPVELDGGRQRAEPFEEGDVHCLPQTHN